ncbi:unnamed protein product [Trifolium pratense]|uniref:Uncharacterized protein n=1 Tax=Trifolium pratense TaxID=57577 RepID=A0ACB0LU11_TRIPR|nr:unnamed protein product [Trifolium pratense]
MALSGTALSFNGLSSTLKEFNFSPGLFMNSFNKRHHVCLSSFEPNRLVFGKSERGNQLSISPNQCLKFQMRRLEIVEENYAKAAEIRDTLKSLHKDSKTEVLGANNKFYNSFRNGDLAAMQAMWAKRDEVWRKRRLVDLEIVTTYETKNPKIKGIGN